MATQEGPRGQGPGARSQGPRTRGFLGPLGALKGPLGSPSPQGPLICLGPDPKLPEFLGFPQLLRFPQHQAHHSGRGLGSQLS